jgi:uncharacterized membrane protein YfcA
MVVLLSRALRPAWCRRVSTYRSAQKIGATSLLSSYWKRHPVSCSLALGAAAAVALAILVTAVSAMRRLVPLDYSHWITGLLLVLLALFLFHDARSRYRRTTITVADYQDMYPSRDFYRGMRDLWRHPEGPRSIAMLALVLAGFLACSWVAIIVLRWLQNAA